MGDTCSCCNSNNDEYDSNMEAPLIINEKWIHAVQDNSAVGCRYVHMADPDVIDQLVDRKTGERAIHIAARKKNKELIEYLCENNVEIDSQSRETKETALHIVARDNDTLLIKLLLSYGSDPDIRNKTGKVARDLCNKNIRREFNKAKVQKLRRLGPPKTTESQTTTASDIYIGGQSISKVNLKTLRNINKHIDNESESTKRAKAKRDEISKREKFLSIFGEKCGCEVDELGAFLEKLDEDGRREVWIKIMRNNKSTDKQTDVKKLLLALTYSVVRKKAQLKAKGKQIKVHTKPDDHQIERLVSVIRRKFPREKNKKILKRHDFINKLHLWLYEIHDDENWKSG